ncbi:TetR-like C-terminal domain-containing protein, partial [Bacillus zanthoxyli]
VSDRLSKPFQVMEQFLHHEEIGKILETQMSDEQFISRAQYLSHETRKQEIEALNQLCKNYTMPNDLIIEFYSGAITSLSAWWFKNERSVSAAEMDQYLHQLINRDIFQFEEE